MFDGADQLLHQFIAANSSSRPNNPLSFPLHGNPSFFDHPNYPPPSLSLLHHHPPPLSATKHLDLISTNSPLPTQRSVDPWSNDEVLALLKLRSTMEIWFPEFTWEHVSRKLMELGYKRGADECKEKFEDESRHFNQSKIFSELDELYTADHHHEEEARFSGRNTEKVIEVDQEKEHTTTNEEVVMKKGSSKKRKRTKECKFEMFKGLCEGVVKKMIAHQEELHNKMIDDILKRDEEILKREEAWKNEEMIRVRKEMEIRSKEQASAAERQGTIIQFLKKFTSHYDNDNDHNHNQEYQTLKTKIDELVNKNDEIISTPLNPSPVPAPKASALVVSDEFSTKMGSDIGKRWPRDEVLALINLRCKMSGNNNNEEEGGATKGPLWERISQGMGELGFKRNAKRCKEKWENINKYFRKTKDSNKKRSLNSRTCPYFHQLSSLYTEGTLLPAAVAPNNEF